MYLQNNGGCEVGEVIKARERLCAKALPLIKAPPLSQSGPEAGKPLGCAVQRTGNNISLGVIPTFRFPGVRQEITTCASFTSALLLRRRYKRREHRHHYCKQLGTDECQGLEIFSSR